MSFDTTRMKLLILVHNVLIISGFFNGTSRLVDNHCVCGLPNESKIVGGIEADAHEFPWMARIRISASVGYLWCSGSLITDKHVLTAAHCVASHSVGNCRVILGEHDSATMRDGQTLMVWVNKFVIYPTYNKTIENNNDMAIIELATEIQFRRNIRPICLTRVFVRPADLVGLPAVIAGWGRTFEKGPLPTKMHKAFVTVVSQAVCEVTYKNAGNIVITNNMICAGKLPEGGKDACQGDSGGPLMIEDIFTGQYHLMGIVSFGFGCGRRGMPGVYTRVDNFKTFIRRNTKKSLKCANS